MACAEDSPSPNPYVFLVGCPRSGTTMLRRMVNAHPAIAITPETHWIPRLVKRRRGVAPNGTVTPELYDWLANERRFPRLKIPLAEVRALLPGERRIAYAEFVTGLFDLYGRRVGKRLVGDKTPGYVADMRLLHELFPRARFVQLIRDGRDVCLSALAWSKSHKNAGRAATWAEDPVSTAALWWKRYVLLGREAGRALGSALYRELRYEALVADPASACAALCRFLALPYDASMLGYHEGRARQETGASANRAWLPPTPGLRDWRVQLPEADQLRFEAVAGDLLDELGYPRNGQPPPEFLEHAARVRDRFDLRPLPHSW